MNLSTAEETNKQTKRKTNLIYIYTTIHIWNMDGRNKNNYSILLDYRQIYLFSFSDNRQIGNKQLNTTVRKRFRKEIGEELYIHNNLNCHFIRTPDASTKRKKIPRKKPQINHNSKITNSLMQRIKYNRIRMLHRSMANTQNFNYNKTISYIPSNTQK